MAAWQSRIATKREDELGAPEHPLVHYNHPLLDAGTSDNLMNKSRSAGSTHVRLDHCSYSNSAHTSDGEPFSLITSTLQVIEGFLGF